MIRYYTRADGPLPCFGVFMGQPPELIDAPKGARVRLRFRPSDFAKAFVRFPDGQIVGWYLEYSDATRTKVKLGWPFAINKPVPFDGAPKP